MPGSVAVSHSTGVMRVTLHNAGKLNAIDIAMWHELRRVFADLQALPADQAPAVVVICGADGHFAAGGDIAEFAGIIALCEIYPLDTPQPEPEPELPEQPLCMPGCEEWMADFLAEAVGDTP